MLEKKLKEYEQSLMVGGHGGNDSEKNKYSELKKKLQKQIKEQEKLL